MDSILTCKHNSRGSELIREEAGASADFVLPELQLSRMNSVPPDDDKPVGAGLARDKVSVIYLQTEVFLSRASPAPT